MLQLSVALQRQGLPRGVQETIMNSLALYIQHSHGLSITSVGKHEGLRNRCRI